MRIMVEFLLFIVWQMDVRSQNYCLIVLTDRSQVSPIGMPSELMVMKLFQGDDRSCESTVRAQAASQP
jgi:hypothetical protein